MKKRFLFVFSIFLLVSCTLDTNTDNTSGKPPINNPTDNPIDIKGNISSDYWGTWIRMDNGDEYYINDFSVFKTLGGQKKYQKIQDGVSNFFLEGENILSQGSIRYFRKGGKHRSFSMNISGFTDSFSNARSVSTGRQGVIGRRENLENASDTENIITDQDGNADFENSVADDEQKIIIETEDGNETSIIVMPGYDGENLGSLPIVEKGMYGFKTTYKIDGDDLGFCYGNKYKYYNLELYFNNIGDISCSTSIYNISSPDSELEFISGSTTGNFSSITPGTSKKVSFKIRYGDVNNEYVDVPINIEITDSKYERTWKDKIILRFYKGFVSLFVNSRNFDENSSATLNGFFIYPDGRSKRFVVNARSKTTVLLPWSESNYLLAFSGANEETEMGYSFCFDDENKLSDLSGVWTLNEINAYENNDTSNHPYIINDSKETIKAYLKADDIDFFSINVSHNNSNYKPIIIDEYSKIAKYDSTDSWYDIRIHNVDNKEHEQIVAKLISLSSEIYVINDTFNYGRLSSNYYKTCYYVESWTYGGLEEKGTYPGTYYTYIKQNYGSQTIKTVVNDGWKLQYPGFSLNFDENCIKGNQYPMRLQFETKDGSITYDDFFIVY